MSESETLILHDELRYAHCTSFVNNQCCDMYSVLIFF